MRVFNSIIRIKLKPCSICGKPSRLFSRGRCQPCAILHDTLAKDVQEDDSGDFKTLVEDLDRLVSLYVRMSAADREGVCKCYTCASTGRWQEFDAGHYISRKSMFLRFDWVRNIRSQCQPCNRSKYGQAAIFAQNLEKELPGVTEILYEESLTVYKWTRDELRSMINDLSIKVNELRKQLK